MNESEIQLFIRAHGESSRPFIDRASLLGYVYIFPEPDFDATAQNALKGLMSKRYSWANYIVDFQVFRKPSSRVFHRETVRRDEVTALFEFSKSAYPESSMAWATLGETSWDELEIYRQARTITPDDFKNWLIENLLVDPQDSSQQISLDTVWRAIASALGKEVYKYRMADNSGDCDFSPYFFIGERIIVMIARQWEL
jgi:hypothetical protein